MKITKTRLAEIVKEELENIKEAGDVTDVLVSAIQSVPKAKQAIQLIQKKNNPQLVANLLVKIHKMVRPEGDIADLFSKAKGSEQKMGATAAKEKAPPEA
tara:strand:- start:1818 stop:2117 length:300 start_codon:yes stop_codon:yes gene_type:complete